MAHIHYKFSSKLISVTVQFDGPHITLRDLKRQIMSKEKLRAADSDLQITNGQTSEAYTDEEQLIPNGSSVIVRRIPVIGPRTNSNSKTRNIERPDVQFHHTFGAVRAMNDQSSAGSSATLLSKMTSLVDADASEDDKIKAVIDQSSYSLNYNKTFGSVLPANYTCYRCGDPGHHIRNCRLSGNKNAEGHVRIRKSTGIPSSFLLEVDDPNIKGAMLTNCGHYAIPAMHAKAYAIGKKEKPPFVPQDEPVVDDKEDPIPDNLLCLICHEMLCDAVVIPCCGNSYCDDCIRTALLDSDEHTCPTCNQSYVSPDTLIANKVLRQAVNTFKKEQVQAKFPTALFQNPTPGPVAAQPPPMVQSQKPHLSAHSQQDPLLYHAQAKDIQRVDRTQTTASRTLSPLETTNKEAEEKKTPDGSAAAAAAPSVPAPSPRIPQSAMFAQVSHTAGEEQRQAAGVQQQQPPPPPPPPPSSDPIPLLSTSWDRSSSSSGCPAGAWTESQRLPPSSTPSSFSATPPPPPLFPPPLFHKFLAAPQPLSSFPPPGYPSPTPVWPLPTPPHQGAPIPPLCPSSSAIPALIPKEWYRQERKKRERSPHRASSSRHSSSRSNSKSSKSCRSYSRSSSRSRSRSRSRSQSRSRPHSPYSRHSDQRSRSHSSRSYSYGYKRSPTPSSSSSPRRSYGSRSKSPSDLGKNSHHSRHHGRKSSSGSSGSRRRGDRSQREAGSSGGSLAGYLFAQQANPAASSLELDRERYLQWKRGYREWCDKYFSSYVGHFHQLPPPLLGVPVSPLALWADGGGSGNHSDSRGRLQGRRTAREDGRSPPSHSSSDSRSPPSQPSSDRRSTPSQSLSDSRSAPSRSSDSRSTPSQSSSDSRSSPSHSSSDGRSTPSEDGARPRCDEKHSRLPVTPTKSSDEAERGGDKQKKNPKDLSTFKPDQKSVTKHEEGGREESSSPAGADSMRDCRKTKSKHNVGPNICEHGTQQQDKTTASEALEPDRALVKPDKRLEKDRGRKSRERKHSEKEKGWRRDKYSDSRHDMERRHKEKSSKGKDVGGGETERYRTPGGSKESDSSSEKTRKRKGEDVERSSVKAESGKCLKTEITEVPETRQQDSPGPFERKKPKTEKTRERKSWPLTERDIWEGGIKVKPQKKISININLDGKRTEEKTETRDSSYVESVSEKAKDETEPCGNGKEENLNGAIDGNKKDESSREREGVREEKIKQTDGEPRSIWEKATFRDEKREGGEEDAGEMKEDGGDEGFDLWHCALRGEEEEDEGRGEEREEGDNVEARSDGGGRETGEESRHDGPNHAVDDGGACEDRQGRKSVVEDSSQDKLVDQVPRSKWEKKGSEEEEQDEEEIGAQTDAVAAILPSARTPTDGEREGEGEQKRQRSAETEREKPSALSSSGGRLAPSAGKDRNNRTSAPERDGERRMDRERERARDRERGRDRPSESKRSKERARDEEKGRERERERGGVHCSSASAQPKKPSSSSRSPSRSRDTERRDRRRGDDRSAAAAAAGRNTEDRAIKEEIKEEDMEAEREGGSRWRDSADETTRRRRRSSSSSSTNQESGSDDGTKERKRKHENEKRQPGNEELPKEDEGKKHKHKKRKSREGEEEESSEEEEDNRCEDEEDHDKIYSVLLF